MNATARYPSHLISKSQSALSKGLLTGVASIGQIAVGMATCVAPVKFLTAEIVEEVLTTENAEEFGASRVARLEVFFLLAFVGEFLCGGVTLFTFRISALAFSSCCLMSSHSVPLLPGRRERMRTSAKSPFSRLPFRRNLRSPLASMARASSSVPGRYLPSTGVGESGCQVPSSQTITVPAP